MTTPRLSIVVPFQDVEPYLEECLKSIALQVFEDFEVVLVDDGSTDGSGALAEEFCRRDGRFRLIRQEARGPGHARNTGIRAAHPGAEFLAFVDGDDVLPDYAYELLIGTLEESGSDFVSGNVRMMNSQRIWQSKLHGAPMRRARRRTHISRTPELLYDRTVWNKVFRRSFWDRHRIAFPEGVVYEDIWVNLYAHYSAGAVDVVSDHVYFWRRRDGGAGPSITQRLTELDNVRDRFSAVRSVSRFLDGHRTPEYAEHKRRYDLACLKSDLLLHLDALLDADEEVHDHFLREARAFLDEAAPGVVEELPAVDRVKWELVRAGKKQQLLDLLEFERGGGPLPVRRRIRRYLDYPCLDDRSTGVPRSAYRLREEFTMRGSLCDARWEDGVLKLSGRAYVRHLNVHKRRHSVKALALRDRKQGRTIVLRARTTYDPEATEHSGQNRYCYDWSGFEVAIDPARLKRRGRWVEGTWDVAVGSLSRGLFRHGRVSAGAAGTGSHPPSFAVDKNVRVVPLFVGGALKIRVEVVRCRITGHRLLGGHLELSGVLLADATPDTATLRIAGLTGVARSESRVDFAPGGQGWCTFRTRVPLAALVPPARRHGHDVPRSWVTGGNGWKTSLHIPGRKRPLYPVMAPGTADGVYPMPARPGTTGQGGREAVVHRNGSGYLVLFERAALPVVDRCTWSDGGSLTLEGSYPGYEDLGPRLREELCLVVRARAGRKEEWCFPVTCVGGRFTASFTPSRVSGMAGTVPLASGRWDLALRVAGGGTGTGTGTGTGQEDPPQDVLLKTHRDLIEAMPEGRTVDGRRYVTQPQFYDRFTLLVRSAMPDEARGPYRQKLLRTQHYPRCRAQPLLPAVLFDSFRGTQLSDSPRAVFEELVRRGTGLELLWVVRDDQIEVPAPARAVRMWSPEWYEAMARSRYIVANNHLPGWFERREGQVVVQTWHGTPLKRIGHDMPSVHFADRRYPKRIRHEVEQWSMLVSPNRFSTPILRRAFDFAGDLVETGYPRNDPLRAPDRDRRAEEVRRRLGLPEGKRVVLYAPTWRDDMYHGAGRYRFDFRIDLDDAREQLAEDHVLLVRRHPNVVDPVPGAGDGFVRDVSTYPDMADLMLVTDVMVTDYSSLMFDFANTGRPMLFFTYDLEHYRDTLRGFYFDFEETAPGPLVGTSAELIRAIRDVDDVQRRFQHRYHLFQERFCDLEDGGAAGRVVDRMLETGRRSPDAGARPVRLPRLRRARPGRAERPATAFGTAV
ncbi:bifunctional glycosyltransferase/CDP-glycerol:glycerophosphate glycerophosphotransferase [Streptomyces sp. CB03234]|uniref:bifunctional glycosyltransferase/CDP-glycerol:glycerophosphate glycerophosphotransferase n=1 Tax=Streptomyces sp. (strain CB03234) TaxID=1703937 RepID=UPI00093FB9F4|nr:bifunctional glycosyltransferase family 2 protein/CDP-glycerol:glycerophosphate glycerophosphotransferase [Streptomyces sp. CB03234]